MRVREQLGLCLDTLVYEFSRLDERYSLATRVDVAEQLIQCLARERLAQGRKLLEVIFGQSLEALKNANETSNEAKQAAPVPEQQSITSIIGRIMRIAARLDPKLEKAYLKRFVDAEREIAQRSSHRATDRFRLGIQIIDADPNWALAIGEEFLGKTANLDTSILHFLYQLTKRDPNLGDRFLAAMVNKIKARSGRDVNELLLVHSYVTGSSVVPRVSAQGLVPVSVSYKPLSEPTTVSASTAKLVLQVAAELLLDNNRYNSNLAQPLWGIEGDLITIRILQSQVSQLLPAMTEAIIDRTTLLASLVQAERISSVDRAVNEWSQAIRRDQSEGEASSEDRDSLLERAGKTSAADERDGLYYQAARLAIEKGEYTAALEITDKLSEPLRESVKDFNALTIARAKLSADGTETAMEWAKNLSDAAQRAYLLTLIARASINSKGMDHDRAAHVLAEAEANVPSIKETAEKVSVVAGIGNVYLRIDQNRFYGCLQDAIAQANSTEKYSGAATVNRLIKVGDWFFSYALYTESDLSLTELIFQQAQRDFFATLAVVEGIKNPLLQVQARIALYRGADTERRQ